MHKSATVDRRSMPPSGYITHTVSAPSLHGKTVDDTYVQLKKDLEYLDLKMIGTDTLRSQTGKPVKVAESDVDVQLSRLCEQDKVLQELQAKISTLKEDKDKLESVLDMSHQQMEQFHDQPAHAEKIACQQKLLQEDVVHIRAQISWVSTEMERSWLEYCRQEQSVLQLREALHSQMELCVDPQERAEMKRELWRIEDVMSGLSSNKASYKITVGSVQNPERKLAPSVPASTVPSRCVTPALGERSLRSSPVPTETTSTQWQPPSTHAAVPCWAEDPAPPRPPLPLLYDGEDVPPAVPPLPKEAAIIRHTSVRGLKRQSDGRRRDRDGHHPAETKVELRSFLSEPELAGGGEGLHEGAFQTLPSKGLSGSSSRINQTSHLSSFVTLRKGTDYRGGLQERPKSALEMLYGLESQAAAEPPQPQVQPRSRMSAEEQLERMKRHQRALVRERKRNLSQGERLSNVSSSTPHPLTTDHVSTQDVECTEPGEERHIATEVRDIEGLRGLIQPEQVNNNEEWLSDLAVPAQEQDVEPVDFEFDITRELAPPPKVPIPKRYVELELEETLSVEEIEARHLKAEKIKKLLARSSGQSLSSTQASDVPDFDSTQQERERIVGIPRALASEASMKIKQAAAARAASSGS